MERLSVYGTALKGKKGAAGGLDGGIHMPMLVNKWRITKVTGLSVEDNDVLTLQAISLGYRFNAPAANFGFDAGHEFKLTIEESINNLIAPIVRKLMLLKDYDITVANLGGDSEILKLTTFKKCTGIGFDYKYDYVESSACKFPCEFVCEDIEFN